MTYQLTLEEGVEYLRATVSGSRTVGHVLRAVSEIVGACAGAKLSKVLVDVRGLAGSLDMLDSYEIPAAGFAAVKQPGVVKQAAIVDRKDRERSFRFFETVARNRGFNLRFFTEEEDAAAWLSENLGPAPE